MVIYKHKKYRLIPKCFGFLVFDFLFLTWWVLGLDPVVSDFVNVCDVLTAFGTVHSRVGAASLLRRPAGVALKDRRRWSVGAVNVVHGGRFDWLSLKSASSSFFPPKILKCLMINDCDDNQSFD